MPPKTKKLSKKKPEAEKEEASEETDSVPACWLQTLLAELAQLSADKERCSAALQAVHDSKEDWIKESSSSSAGTNAAEGGEEAKEDTVADAATEEALQDAQWIQLGTHTIHRLMDVLRNTKKGSKTQQQQQQESTCIVLAGLCFSLAQALFCDKSRLDRCGSSTNPRIWIGRTLMSVSLGSMQVLEQLVQVYTPSSSSSKPPPKNSLLHIRQALQCAVLALDMCIKHGSIAMSKANTEGWNAALKGLLYDAENLLEGNEEAWEAAWDTVLKSMGPTPIEEACLRTLSGEEMEPEAKNRSRSRKPDEAEPPSAPSSPFQQLKESSEALSMQIDGRVAMRRWASMVFVWCDKGGQLQAMEVLHSILSNRKFWNAVLDCPAVDNPNAAAEKREQKKKKKNKKKRKKGEEEVSIDEIFPEIPGEVATVAFCARIMDIVSESGNNCGARPPTGGMDTYAASILSATSQHDSRSHDNDDKKPALTRPDITDHTAVVVHQLIEAHAASFDQASVDMVNDETPEGASVVEGRTRFYPYVHKSLGALARASAASSASCPSRHTSSMVAAMAFQQGPLRDCRFADFAIHTLVDSLRGLVKDDDSSPALPQYGDTMETGNPEAEFGYDSPLIVPSLPSSAKSSKKKKGTTDNSPQQPQLLGGFYSSIGSVYLNDEEVVKLFVRAMNDGKEGNTSPVTILLERLMQVTQSCYDLGLGDAKETVSSKRSTKGSDGKRKKRKISAEEGVATDDTPPRCLRKLTSVRAGLATDSTTALKLLLLRPRRGSSGSESRLHLRRYWRHCLTDSLACQLVELNQKLADIMPSLSLKGTLETGKRSLSNVGSSEYSSFVDTLWASHWNLCAVVGRGRRAFDLSTFETTTVAILGSPDRRLAVFRKVAEMCCGSDDKWPLHLPTTQISLVTANLGSEPIKVDAAACSPEHYIIQTFIAATTSALQDLTSVTTESWYKEQNGAVREIVARDDVPLAYRDGQLLLLAFSRLPTEMQSSCFSQLVSSVSEGLRHIVSTESLRDLVAKHPEVSSFIARLITLLSTMANIILAKALRRTLFSETGLNYNIPPPAFVSRSETCTTKEDCDKEGWYTRDTCYVNFFYDWESPFIPDVGLPDRLHEFGPDAVRSMNSLIEDALYLGFMSGKNDGAHLLFSSWNAAGQRPVWNSSPPSFYHDLSHLGVSDLPGLLINLREDIWHVYGLNHSQDATPETTLKRLLRRRGGQRTRTLVEELKFMMTKAESLVDRLIGHIKDQTEKSDDIEPVVLSSLTAVTSYIAFIAATHTKPSVDYFGRPRRSSFRSSDDSMISDDSEIEDSLDTTLSDFHSACGTFGAAPVHPDWLDLSCRRNAVAEDEAKAIAERAVSSLTKVAAFAHSEQTKAVCKSIEQYASSNEVHSVFASRVWRLAGGDTESDLDESDDESLLETYPASLETLAGVEPGSFSGLFSPGMFVISVGGQGTFLPNSCQRISGKAVALRGSLGEDPAFCEYRATGDWELLLTDSLLGSCISVHAKDRNSAASPIADTYSLTERWKYLYEASISNLMPAAALLRFVVSGCAGRKFHPLNRLAPSSDLAVTSSTSPYHFDEAVILKPNTRLDQTQRVTKECVATLARICGTNPTDVSLKRLCNAVAANLLAQSADFESLSAMELLQFVFETLFFMKDTMSDSLDTEASGIVVKNLLSLVESHVGQDYAGQLLSFLLASPARCSLIVEPFAQCSTLLSILEGEGEWQERHIVKKWDWTRPQQDASSLLIQLLFERDWELEDELHLQVADIISKLVEHEYRLMPAKLDFSAFLLNSLNALAQDVNKRIINCIVQADDETQILSEKLCSMFIYCLSVVGPERTEDGFAKSVLLDGIVGLLQDSDETRIVSKHATVLLFLLACRFKSLYKVGSLLLSIAQRARASDSADPLDVMGPVEEYLSLLQDVESAIDEGSTMQIEPSSLRGHSVPPGLSQESSDAQDLPSACSFVLRDGFHGQHWYNCYTCGLTWDKGCCSLCVLKCHKGHDVSYSRFSSFFCDCGAESPSDDTPSRVKCKCLSSLPQDEVKQLFADERSTVLDKEARSVPKTQGRTVRADTRADKDKGKLYTAALDIATSTLKASAGTTLAGLRQEIGDSWHRTMFDILSQETERFVQQGRSTTDVSASHTPEQSTVSQMEADRLLRQRIAARYGQPLNLLQTAGTPVLPIRSARAGALNMKLSSDSTTDRLKSALLKKNRVRRYALVADSRGRLIVAEPCSLLFCAILPAVNANTSSPSGTLTAPYNRNQLCILGNASLKFNIVGMKLCQENERHLLVWGTTEACVVVLSGGCDKVDRIVELEFEIDPHECEADYLIKCDWIPGSQTSLIVACGLFVKVFDTKLQGNANQVLPSQFSFYIEFDGMLRDVAFAPEAMLKSSSDQGNASNDQEITLHLVLLFDTGTLHLVELNFDSNLQLTNDGEQYIQSSGARSFSTAGLRLLRGASPEPPNTSGRSLGEGSVLASLRKSGLLVYQCTGSCVVAMRLGPDGDLTSSFELLPNCVTSETLENGSNGDNVVGPFSHWTELGMIEKEGAAYFRAVCVGKSSRTSRPKILCVDFNETKTFVKEIIGTFGGASGLGLSLSSSLEGIASFSAPVILDEHSETSCERSCVAAVSSNGALLVFGEDLSGQVDSKGEGLRTFTSQASSQSFPVTLFEKLEDLSESESLVFGGDGVGGDPVSAKVKLLSKNNVYLMSPSRDGCTITAALQRSSPGRPLNDGNCPTANASRDDLAIVAIRLLVGATDTDFIPKFVSVEGRRIDLKPAAKRWYDLPLTPQEIAFGLRNGFVTINVGPSYDSNSAVVDGIEIYATDRKRIDHWIPKNLRFKFLPADELAEAPKDSPDVSRNRDDTLVLSLRTLAHLCKISKPSGILDGTSLDTLKRIVETFVLDDNTNVCRAVTELLCEIQPSASARKEILDEASLYGVADHLRQVQNQLTQSSSEDLDATRSLVSTQSLLSRCLQIADGICVARPRSYAKANERLIASNTSKESVAKLALSLIWNEKLDDDRRPELIVGVVNLALTEAAYKIASGESEHFASFVDIEKLLGSTKPDIARLCTSAAASFVERGLISDCSSAPLPGAGDQKGASIRYRCDSCSLFPIGGQRFTILEGGSDIDLCTECFLLAFDFAARHSYDAKTSVIVNESAVGGSGKFSCADVKLMSCVPVQTTSDTSMQEGDDDLDESMELELALRLSRGEDIALSSNAAPAFPFKFDDFVTRIFSTVLKLVLGCLAEEVTPSNSIPSYLTQLLLAIIESSRAEEFKVQLAKEFSEAITSKISFFLQRDEPGHSQYHLSGLLRSLSGLFDGSRPERDETHTSSPAKRSPKTDPRFVCDVHGVPAVRRRCSQGANKNRRFYVCGMDRDNRCKYFKWVDGDDSPAATGTKTQGRRNQFAAEIGPFLWGLFSKQTGSSAPLHAQLCQLVEKDASQLGLFDSSASSGQGKSKSNKGATESNLYGLHDIALDFEDGVFCSREKLCGPLAMQDHAESQALGANNRIACVWRNEGETSVIGATLHLLSLIAAGTGTPQSETDKIGPGRWYSLLCEVISSSSLSSDMRAEAKTSLKRFCGGRRDIYLSVRDRHSYASQYRGVLSIAYGALRNAVDTRERARQCGVHWAAGERFTLLNLPAGALIGTCPLISDDYLPVTDAKKIFRALNEMLGVAKSRGDTWRQFCANTDIPSIRSLSAEVNQAASSARKDTEALFATSPIVSLFWLASTMPGRIRLKALKLVNLALTNNQITTKQPRENQENSAEMTVDEDGFVTTDGEHDGSDSNTVDQGTGSRSALIAGQRALSLDEIYAFSRHFVLADNSVEIRKFACQVAAALYRSLSNNDVSSFTWLFESFASRALESLATHGATCVQGIQLLQSVLSISDTTPQFDFTGIAETVISCLLQQMQVLKSTSGGHSDTIITFQPSDNGEEKESVYKKFDMSLCVHCHRQQGQVSKTSSSETSPATSAEGSGVVNANDKSSSPNTRSPKWLSNQIRPYARTRLDAMVTDTVSSEFKYYARLKCRMAISEIQLTVTDPRGRFAKTIVVHFLPRPVSDVNQLKSNDCKWQACATFSLTRGQSRVSSVLSEPVVAANLMIEYVDFYERPGGSTGEDGTLLIHCPRCTRIVHNAHGVCGNCGEVAFQCRKCRHINYDRLDAFLCVECGYCSAGSFGYELNAGMASNAVAIIDEESYERTVSILREAKQLHEELETALKEKVRLATSKRPRTEDDSALSDFSPALKRAYLGKVPLIFGEGSEARTSGTAEQSARSRSNSEANRSSSRVSSLLRLARQLRASGGESISELENELAGMDSSDQVAALVRHANDIAASRSAPESSAGGRPRSSTNETRSRSNSEATPKVTLEECEKLYQLMREAERECYELQLRIDAWQRLEHDNLLDLEDESEDKTKSRTITSFQPCHCMACCGPIALNLLILTMKLIQSDPERTDRAISQKLIRVLLNEYHGMDKDLRDLKRMAIMTLAGKSTKRASELVLEELRARLVTFNDPTAAEILGKILETQPEIDEAYVKLATDTLGGGY